MYTNSYNPGGCMGAAPVVMPTPCMNQGQMMQPGMPVYPNAVSPVQPMPIPSYPNSGCMNQPMPMPYPGGVSPMQPLPNQGCMNQPMPMPYPGGVNPMQPLPNQGCMNQPMPMPYPGSVSPMQPLPNQGCMNQPMPLPIYPDQGCQPYPVQPQPQPQLPEYDVMPMSNYQQTVQTYQEPVTTTTNYKKTTYIEAVVPVQSDVPLMQPTVQKKKVNVVPAVQSSNMEDDYGMFFMDNNFEQSYGQKARTNSNPTGAIKCENLPLAQTYVQPQVYQKVNDPEKTMAQGTYFQELYLPYKGGNLK